ncbi:MAG: hypothetical protein ACWIPJ_09940 [Polaribacter sp.]
MKTSKNKLSNFLKFGIFLFGFSLLLWNCENQEETPKKTFTLSISTVDATNFLNNFKKQSILKNQPYLNKGYKKTTNSNLLDFSIIPKYAKHIQENNYESYTFSIIRKNPFPNIQENYLISQQADGSYKEYLIWYFMDKESFSNAIKDYTLLEGIRIKKLI